MKKIMLAALVLVLASNANAAVVTIDSIDSGGSAMNYSVNGSTYDFGTGIYSVYINQSLVNVGDNGGEELIYLGAHERSNYAGSDQTIAVDIDNANIGDTTTGDVSLVLSAAEDTIWDFSIESGVQLNNIFIIAQGTQTLLFNGESISLGLNASQLSGSTLISRSNNSQCGYALPDDIEGCNTDQILGLPSQTYFLDPLETLEAETNENNENFLAELTSLQVTSFNGSYIADSFNITIDSTVVPIPAAIYLFVPPVLLLFSRRFFQR